MVLYVWHFLQSAQAWGLARIGTTGTFSVKAFHPHPTNFSLGWLYCWHSTVEDKFWTLWPTASPPCWVRHLSNLGTSTSIQSLSIFVIKFLIPSHTTSGAPAHTTKQAVPRPSHFHLSWWLLIFVNFSASTGSAQQASSIWMLHAKGSNQGRRPSRSTHCCTYCNLCAK